MDGRSPPQQRPARPAPPRSIRSWPRLGAIIALSWIGLGIAHAAPVYRCAGAHGETVYQDTPCAHASAQRMVDITPQPLIGDPGEPPPASIAPGKRRPASTAPRAARTRPKAAARRAAPTSFGCRAANGEVFYRHARCPGSVPGDGVVRVDYAEHIATESPRRRQSAWDRVPVRGTAVPRAEACRRIRSAGAAGRDGHVRDDRVSAYDRAMGRDPCDAP